MVSCLGTDEITRSFDQLLMKAKALRNGGLTVLYLYWRDYPSPKSVTGDVLRDQLLIDEIIGLKTSIGEQWAGKITLKELAKYSGTAYLAGMLSGKAGILHVHLGEFIAEMGVLFALINEGKAYNHIVLTHANKTQETFARSLEYVLLGGHVDFTPYRTPLLTARKQLSPAMGLRKC